MQLAMHSSLVHYLVFPLMEGFSAFVAKIAQDDAGDLRTYNDSQFLQMDKHD